MKFKIQNDNLIKILLENRSIKTKKEVEEFLNPSLKDISIENVGINKIKLKEAISRIEKAIKNKEQIVVFGDYDVDGICGTAILWETLRLFSLAQGKPYDNVFSYIPHRIDEGYGLSIKGIQNVQDKYKNVKLIITVDNGIVANNAVDFANKQGIDVIITDHHVPSKKLPNALTIVHTTKLCGTGVAWLLSSVILNSVQDLKIPKQVREDTIKNHLELVALATVADLVPLIGANRTLLKFGLIALQKTKRIGLLALYAEAGLSKDKIGVYEIGHIIAPRLNAMGRMEYAMESLRLLCATDKKRAELLAYKLGSTNRQRQELTMATVVHAITTINDKRLMMKNLLFIAEESYQQGVIGLVAGRLVEEFYRPAIVISKGKKLSRASARSVRGFNIIEFIRNASEFLVDAGGHPMAAGFTVETSKLEILEKKLHELADRLIHEDMLTRSIRVDCELPLAFVNQDFYNSLQKLAPFGMGNPEPTFVTRGVVIENARLVGRDGKHIKLELRMNPSTSSGEELRIDGIGFGLGERVKDFRIGDNIDIVYTIDENEWNGNKKLQLKIKDIR